VTCTPILEQSINVSCPDSPSTGDQSRSYVSKKRNEVYVTPRLKHNSVKMMVDTVADVHTSAYLSSTIDITRYIP
jgi:hypothetical protein